MVSGPDGFPVHAVKPNKGMMIIWQRPSVGQPGQVKLISTAFNLHEAHNLVFFSHSDTFQAGKSTWEMARHALAATVFLLLQPAICACSVLTNLWQE